MAVSTFAPDPSAPGGTLTLTLNGKVMAVWDAMDHLGRVVPNGFYHLVITQALADGTQVVLNRAVYVNPHAQKAQIQLSAYPNLVSSGAPVQVSASVEGNPAEGADLIKIYAMNGELLKTLDLVNGQAVWDLTNKEGKQVASGLYFIVFDVLDPATRAEAHKAVKVVVLR